MGKTCISCGMPLNNKEDFGIETKMGPLCKYCINEDGSVKACVEIFTGGVKFFMDTIPGTDKELAERITRKNMSIQPYWQGKEEECLKGDQATDEEFQEALAKL